MAYYFVANIRINDPEAYGRYLERTSEVFARYQGVYLAVDPEPRVLEGSWDYGRAVVIRFPSKEAFEKWYFSEEYQEILTHRLKGADCDTILLKGRE